MNEQCCLWNGGLFRKPAHNLPSIDQKFPRRVVQVAANDSCCPREHVTHPENRLTSRAVFTVPRDGPYYTVLLLVENKPEIGTPVRKDHNRQAVLLTKMLKASVQNCATFPTLLIKSSRKVGFLSEISSK